MVYKYLNIVKSMSLLAKIFKPRKTSSLEELKSRLAHLDEMTPVSIVPGGIIKEERMNAGAQRAIEFVERYFGSNVNKYTEVKYVTYKQKGREVTSYFASGGRYFNGKRGDVLWKAEISIWSINSVFILNYHPKSIGL